MNKLRDLTGEEQELLSSNPHLFEVYRIGNNPNKAGSKIKWTEEQIDFIKKDYQQNLDVKRLSLLFKVSEQAMREWLHKFGIKTLTKTEKNRLLNIRDSDFFEVINTPDKAYWLGFLYADGGISADKTWLIRINLKADDRKHLEKFLLSINDKTDSIKTVIKKEDSKEYKGVYISIADKKMVQDVIDKGCIPNKSFTITFPSKEQVPEELINHFIRGYFDGDGSISFSNRKNSSLKYYQGSIIGTKDILENILKYIGKENLKITPLNKTDKTAYSVSFSGNRMMERLGEYLYKNSNNLNRLDRKYLKFQELNNQRKNMKGKL